MSKKTKAKGRGIPVDMEYDSGLEDDRGSGAYVLPRASALSAFPQEMSSIPTSKKERQKAAAAAAAAVIAAAEAEKAAQVKSDRLYEEYMEMHRPPKPPKSVTCALCKKSETVGDAIAHKWKKHPFGFANQAICAACDAATVPFTSSPKLVWKREPNMLSAQQARLQKLLDHASAPPNALKANIAETAVFELTPKQRMKSFHGMHDQLSAKLLTPPVAEVIPFSKAEFANFTDATYKRNSARGGTKSKSKSKRSKSRSKSRSRSRSKSRSRAHC
jgi:hypothetical protein